MSTLNSHHQPTSLTTGGHTRAEDSKRNRDDHHELSERSPLMASQTDGKSEVEIVPKKPTLAKPETDEDDNDSRDKPAKPYPGVDDGLLDRNPDVEEVPAIDTRNSESVPNNGTHHSENPTDDVDAGTNHHHPTVHYPFGLEGGEGHHHDIEFGSIPGTESIPDVNVYQHKKTLAQGMMDLALFSANANQLRYVLESYERHPYYYPSVVLISFSLLFQVGVGIGLIWNATYNVKDDKEICLANKINNFTVIGIFLITVVNVFISAFGVATPVSAVIPVSAVTPLPPK